MKLLFPVLFICLFALNTTNAQESDTTIFLLDSSFYEMVDSDYEDFLEYADSNYYLIEDADTIIYYSSSTVYVSFIVETDGSITNIKQAEGTFCEDEEMVKQAISIVEQALNTLGGLHDFTPANIQGVAVRISYVIPINFY